MAAQLSGKATLVILGGMATLWLFMYSPLLARLWPILRGSCQPTPGPVSRWDELWGMGWMRFHDQLAKEVARADRQEGYQIIFYGDSISEDWRGTSGGLPWPIGAGTSAVFQKHFGKYRPEVLAIAGDQVGHLWWRILNGELPAARQPRLYTMLIGTNDLTAADCHRNETELLATVPGIAARVNEIVRILRTQAPDAHILLQGLLPRGSSFWGAAQWKWPNRFTKPLAAVNAAFQELAAADPKMHFVECGQEFIQEEMLGTGLDPLLLPDGLHPNAAGMEFVAQCLEAVIGPIMEEAGLSSGGGADSEGFWPAPVLRIDLDTFMP